MGMLLASAGLLRSADHNQNWTEVRSPHFIVLCNSGEKEGRHVAQQFENIRAVFHAAFPKIHVDPGKPTIIFALRNEDSLKLFIPGYGLNAKAKRLGGLFTDRVDMNLALVRTDMSSSSVNEYHALYHEYTHSILHMNFRGLPLWLDEGLAEFYGSTRFQGNQASLGMVDLNPIRVLQTQPFIPIATLVSADTTSPLYNAQEHSGIFYAESWALVHYFMFDPEVKNAALLDKFLAALQTTDDPVEAARQSFGDLKKLSNRLESYARQAGFNYGKLAVESDSREKDFTARPLPPAEALTQEANFLLRTGHTAEALNDLHEAADADPKLPALHEAMGYYHFLRSDNENADKEFDQTISLDPNDALAYYYKAEILYRKSGYSKQSTPLMRAGLEKAAALAPNFAPTHAFLCILYIQDTETKPKSIAEAKRAIELAPGNLAYYIDLGRAALANGKTADAKTIAERAEKAATTPRDRSMTASFAKRLAAGSDSASRISTDATIRPVTSEDDTAATPAASSATAEGQISELICGKPPEVLLTMSAGTEQMLLHVSDISKIEITVAGQVSTSVAMPCSRWKERKAKLTFDLTPDGSTHGEVRSIAFP